MFTLYDYYRSSASFRVRIALNLKGLPYEAVPIHLVNNGGEQHSASYTAINPQNLVPTLKIDSHQSITQSLAILEYLEEAHPTPSILPKDIYQRAQARAFALIITADIHPLNNLRVLNYLTQRLNVSEDKKTQWYQYWVVKGLIALEAHLTASPFSGEYCFGDRPTFADICLIPQLFNAKRFNCDLKPYPTLARIDKHCLQNAAFIDAWPQEVKTEIL